MAAFSTASFRPIARGGVIATGIALILLALTTRPVAAATTIGSPAGNSGICINMDTVQLSTTAGNSYAIPTGGGTLTSWSTLVGASTGQAALLVWRPTATTNTFMLVGESPMVNLTANTTNTFTLATPIAVQTGDLLGLHESSSAFCVETPGTGTWGYSGTGTPAAGSSEAFKLDPFAMTLDVSANLGTTTTTPPPPPPGPGTGSGSGSGSGTGCTKDHDRDSHHHTSHSKAAKPKKGSACDDVDKPRKDQDKARVDRDR